MNRLLAALLMFVCLQVLAVPEYDVDSIRQVQTVDRYLSLDNNAELSADSIRYTPLELWQQGSNQHLGFTITPQGKWYRFDLRNNGRKPRSMFLVLQNRNALQSAQVFVQQHELALEIQSLSQYRNNVDAAVLQLEPVSLTRVYLFLRSELPLNEPVQLYDRDIFLKDSNASHSYMGIAIGGVLCLALVQFILFFGSGANSFLLLGGYFFCRCLLLAAALGWDLYYIVPSMPELKGVDMPLLIAFSSVFLFLFTAELFTLKRLHSGLYKTIRYLCLLLLAYIPLSLMFSTGHNMLVSIVIYMCATLIVSIIAFFLLQQQVRLAKLLIIICLLELLFVTSIVLSLLWPESGLTQYRNELIVGGFWLNALMISYLISRQFFYQNKDRVTAQQLALEHALSSERAQAELLALQQENQEALEQHVQERTLELNIALQELEQANQELERKNMLDELSGLHNRRFYDQKILAEYRRSKRNLTPLSLVLIDIDFFKKINDNFGHIAGDYCIEQVAQQIKNSLKRSTDVSCRYGGEEFCLILPDTETKGALELAEKLRATIMALTVDYQGQQIRLTISCGVSTYQQQPQALPEDIFAAADKALYLAKTEGRNQVHYVALEQYLTSMESNND